MIASVCNFQRDSSSMWAIAQRQRILERKWEICTKVSEIWAPHRWKRVTVLLQVVVDMPLVTEGYHASTVAHTRPRTFQRWALSTAGSSTRRDSSYHGDACRLDMAIARDGRCSPFDAPCTSALVQVEQAGEALRSKFPLENLHLASLWAAVKTRTIAEAGVLVRH